MVSWTAWTFEGDSTGLWNTYIRRLYRVWKWSAVERNKRLKAGAKGDGFRLNYERSSGTLWGRIALWCPWKRGTRSRASVAYGTAHGIYFLACVACSYGTAPEGLTMHNSYGQWIRAKTFQLQVSIMVKPRPLVSYARRWTMTAEYPMDISSLHARGSLFLELLERNRIAIKKHYFSRVLLKRLFVLYKQLPFSRMVSPWPGLNLRVWFDITRLV